MNTEKMSHVVSMTANVGVLIGLSLLVYELNQNNRHLEEQAEFVALQNRLQSIRTFANPDYSDLYYHHLNEQPLSALNKLRRGSLANALFVEWQWSFERERAGLVRQFDSLDHMAMALKDVVERAHLRDVWANYKIQFSTDFVEFMDTQVIGPG